MEALTRYELITGNTVFYPRIQVFESHQEHSWLVASADAVIVRPCGGVLEIECPFFDGERSNPYPWSRIPIHCIPEAQGLMQILGRDWMDFYVWTPNGSSVFRLYRDPEYWDVMKIAMYDFWWKHVHPAREFYSSNVIRRTVRPLPRHELCGDIVCRSKHIAANAQLLLREIHPLQCYSGDCESI